MNDFDFWYAYFDSLFLKPKPNPHLSFAQTINIKELSRQPFPECKKLPQISKCFQEFQKFLHSQQTWIECQCEHSVLKEVEHNVNLIAILISIEKKYAQDFWHHKRRIQASICHFFSLLVFFIVSLFPSQDSRETLQNLKSVNKLCTSMKTLQELVNKILTEINPIIQFLYQQSFAEEKKLTILFLQQIREFLLNLPALNKKKFKHQFELSKYLYVIIPIQLSKGQYKFKTKRKKTMTISHDLQMKYHSDETLSNSTKKEQAQQLAEKFKRLSLQKLNEKAHKINFRTKIIMKIVPKDYSVAQSEIDINSTGDQNLPKIFKFSQKLRKYSFYLGQKKFTKATFQTRQTMELKVDLQKQRKISDFGKTSSPSSREKQFGRTYSTEKKRLLTNETIRSKKSSFHRIHRKTVIEENENYRHLKQKTLAKSKRKNEFTTTDIVRKALNQVSPPKVPSKRVNLKTGLTKGWGIIQEQINKNVTVKKIHQLIHLKEVE